MLYRNLGRSGLKVSAVGLGANRFGNKISGATAPEHVAANAKGAEWGLGADEMAEVDQILGVKS
jgi:aryl-alcohol dehydrogenase-like predicted oxidoreductase